MIRTPQEYQNERVGDEDLLPALRALLSSRPELVDYPERLAALLGVDVFAVEAAMEALEVEGEVLA